jgi:hypothetical protein
MNDTKNRASRARVPVALLVAVLSAQVPYALAQSVPTSSLGAWSDAASMPSSAPIQAGYAPMDQALATLVPAPYHILVDRSISRHAVLTWRSGNDWMAVLRNALAPMNLRVRADWNTNTIEIYPAQVMPAPREMTSAVVMPATATSAPAAVFAPVAPSHFVTTTPASAASAAPAPWPAVASVTKSAAPAVTVREPKVTTPAPVRAGTLVYVKGGNNVKAVPVGAESEKRAAEGAGAQTFGMDRPFDGAYVMPAGETLSSAMTRYAAKFGWKLEWAVDRDYKISVPFPVPKGTIEHGILYIVRVYQSQGGMLGVQPFFYVSNHVVAIRDSTTPQARGQE